jgi:hypothetical protein
VIRRSFRIGLWLGLIAGVGFAAVKLFRPKPSSSVVLDLGTHDAMPPRPAPSAEAWQPLEVPVATPDPVEVPEPDIAPVIPAAEPGLVLVGDEPLQEPIEPAPAAAAVVPEWPATTPAPVPADDAAFAPEPAPAPAPAAAAVVKKVAPVKKAAAKKAAAPKKVLPPWVDPKGGICPKTHPVKGKLASMIFQVPGNFAYDRTNPDRCYQSTDLAITDGLRPAKR